ncbi:hypothetical protein F5Y19DRAFT_336171 [Xylariaceae sp. FL1651]|nr:hypothetical protein F5Y19DRAFT_336171 [Xylariaceae sp. FL1651]
MAEHPVRGYVQRSRHDRRVKLAQLVRDHHADVSVVLGLSWRVKGHQTHIDYASGLDLYKIKQTLISWATLKVGNVLPRIWPRSIEGDARRVEARQEAEVQVGQFRDRPETLNLKDALVRAAPVDLQHGSLHRVVGATAEAQYARRLAESDRKSYDFAAVLSRVDTRAIAHLALDLLQERQQRHLPAHCPTSLPLPQISSPFFGSAHIFYVIQFWDDRRRETIRWIMKIPAANDKGTWDNLCMETLRTETFLLHMLRTETSIPVPEVIDADRTADNKVHAPWLLMELVQGRRLEDVWFDLDIGGDMNTKVLKKKREKILRNVADAMLQLGRYEFDQGGAPLFNLENGQLDHGVGSLRELDVQAMVERWFADEDCEKTPLYQSTGPWDDTTAMYTAMLDAYPPNATVERGVDELLRLLVSHIREPVQPSAPGSPRPSGSSRRARDGKKFVLTHPDLSMRNIILAEDGTTIKAILGWDGARAAPRSLGNEALPRWLVRDFNPFLWRWRPAADFWRRNHVPPECNRFEDPPWVLRELRESYARAVRELKRRKRSKDDETGPGEWQGNANEKCATPDARADVRERHDGDEGNDIEGVDLTMQSLLTLTLDAAIRDPRCRTAALRRVLEKCSRSFEELDFDFFVETLGKGHKIDAYKVKCLADNVKELVDKGFVKGAVVW